MTKVVVHHLDNSRSHRILWLLEELEVPYELELYKRDRKMRAPPELAKVHPLGKSPVVTIGDAVLAESGAVIDELIDRYGEGRLRPAPGTDAHRRYRYFLHYAEGSLVPPLLVQLITNRIKTAPLPFFAKPIAKKIAAGVDETFTTPELLKHYAFLEDELGARPYFTGDELTGADIQLSYPLEAAAARGRLDQRYPRIGEFLDRIHQRPAYQRALARGGKYELLA